MSGRPEHIPEELHVLAGEYVLGALEAAEMRAVRRQAMVTPALAEAISGWERRLAPMSNALRPIAPPEALWTRIADAIAPVRDEAEEEASRASASPVRPAPIGVPPELGTAEVRSPIGRPRESMRSELERLRPAPRQRPVWPWQVATAGALAIAAAVATILLVPALALRTPLGALTEWSAPQVAAIVPPDAQTPGFLAQARWDGTVVLTALAQANVPAGKSLELWILPPGAAVPRSLGVLPAVGRQVVLPAMPVAGTALMVSLEPPGGSPTGAPTGPVVYAGKLQQMHL
jgi:anti-sigma-K factor RskA